MSLATKSKPTGTFQKKRQAGHHRQSKHYLKPYWPYLPMLMIVVVGLMINSLWSGQHHVLGVSSDFSSATLLTDTNQARAAGQQTPLASNPQLTAAAQAKANDMVSQNYWAHDGPDGQTPWSFITAAGYTYRLAGENLAYGFANANQAIAGWMSSPEHRANILNNDYQAVGFGVASSPDYVGKGPQTIIVAEYAAPVSTAANLTLSAPTPATVTLQQTELAAQPVARIQSLTDGHATWATLTIGGLAGAALVLLLIRHGWYWRRLITRGELFVTHHPVFDIVAVAVVMAGFILTRASGFIR